ncbi:hypothetical protein [Chitinivibrio alkaliphilus]|uniref:Outer membrane protein beta-barrel domain-containing protein n=1 Tax=Chitinivibrio alkaliphilus ACht1 TaxID=1313304 RepID=U7D5M1_9BACT|nr:hypothetical protein [Chitinivibrio alkaliphilus]ERP31268.1 hypothetical protein CALK_1887 [Chitinivibrio alkaliphilus ACht1]
MKTFLNCKMICVVLFLLSGAFGRSYDSWALGPSLGFYVPEGSWGRYFSNNNPAVGAGFNGDIRFSLGSAGEIAYAPTIDFWLRHDSWKRSSPGYVGSREVELTDFAIHLNLFSAKYFPPISDVVKPYAGLSLLTIPIYYHSETVKFFRGNSYYTNYGGEYTNGGTTDVGLGADIFAGCEFRISPRLSPYIEVRYSGSNNNAPDVFKLRLGLAFEQD